MYRLLSILVLTFWSWTVLPTQAMPVVVADVATTHSLVSMVMGAGNEPELLLSSSASPHDYAMRPSEAAALGRADVVFWVGAGLTPWLPRALSSLAPTIRSVELLETPGTLRLERRETPLFAAHAHEHDLKHTDELIDPHAWLSPVNAGNWLRVIADTLSEIDPTQSALYQANARRSIEELNTLDASIARELSPAMGKPFIVFHDSYQYLEQHYQLPATASISLADGTLPSIRQIQALRLVLTKHPRACVFSEPQYSERLVDTISQGLDIRRGVLDPLGTTLTPGITLYGDLLQSLADTLIECLVASADPE